MPSHSPDQILAELQPIFREVLEQPSLNVTLKSNASNTSNWDSFAHIDIIELVERRFNVRFALGEVRVLKEVGDLVALLIEKTDQRS